MKVKFGFLLSTIQTIVGGTYDPIASFREQKITTWLVKIGEKVLAPDVVLVRFATDKADVEVTLSGLCVSAKNGTVVKLNYQADQTWKYNGIEDVPGDKMFLPELGWIEIDENIPVESPITPMPKVEPKPKMPLERIHAAPATRKLAYEAGIDLAAIKGTGPFDRVTRADVERTIAERVNVPEQPTKIVESQKSVLDGIILLTPSREKLTIRDNLVGGDDYPLAGGEAEAYDLIELLRLKAQYRKEYEQSFGASLHLSAPVMIAVTRVLRIKRFWLFNGYWYAADKNDKNKDKVALYTSVNMGIAVDFGKEPEIDLENRTIGGVDLRIATLHRADELGLKEFIKQHHDLIVRAASDINENNGRLKQMTLRDWIGWTFIFNNIGAARHIRGLSVPTRRISAMLNMGVIGKDGKTVFQVFFDHRMISGVPVTLFMDAVYEELTKRVIPEIELVCASQKK